MIRKFKKEDIESVMNIWIKGNTEAHSFIDADYWKSSFNMVKEMIADSEIYVYDENKIIKGFIGFNGNCIEGIFVDNIFRSQGIGKVLIDYGKSIKNELILYVYAKNNRAENFYLREGFVIVSENIDCQTGEKEHTMLWKLLK